MKQGEAQSLTFYNEPRGALLIVKKDSLTDAPLPGAVFQVLTSNGQFVAQKGGKLTSNGLYTTDAQGQILISDLEPATLVVRETQAPEGYVLDSTPQTVDISADDMQTLTFTDTPLQTVTIRKFIGGTDKPLQGVTFHVADGAGKPVGSGEYITDASGKITIPGIAPGTTISAREVKTVKGYALNGTPQNLEVKAGADNTLTFFNDPLSSLVIHKYIDGTENEPLSGVQFKITDGSGAGVGNTDGVYYTDHAGEITLTDLQPGTVIKARETKTVSGYVLDGTPQDIQITAGGVYELTFWNKLQGSLTVKKLDSVTREPLSGAEFKITYANGRVVDAENGQISSNGTYFTNERGEIVLNGITGTVVVTEVKSVEGYSINPDSRSQTVTVNPNDGQTVTFFNDPAQTLTINHNPDSRNRVPPDRQ